MPVSPVLRNTGDTPTLSGSRGTGTYEPIELATLFKYLMGTDLDKNLIVKGNILLGKIEK